MSRVLALVAGMLLGAATALAGPSDCYWSCAAQCSGLRGACCACQCAVMCGTFDGECVECRPFKDKPDGGR